MQTLQELKLRSGNDRIQKRTERVRKMLVLWRLARRHPDSLPVRGEPWVWHNIKGRGFCVWFDRPVREGFTTGIFAEYN